MYTKLMPTLLLFIIFISGEIYAGEDANNFIDYVSLYNKENLPIDFREEDNAASLYQEAIKAYIEIPYAIKHENWRIWPDNLSKRTLEPLREWVKSNDLALDYFKQASKKPYFWTEKISPYGSVMGILLPDLREIRELTRSTCFRAMLEVSKGNIRNAAEDIETVYRVGNHFNGPQFTVEQRLGISFKAQAIETVLKIIQNTQLNRKDRTYLYNSLKKYIDDEDFKPNLFAIKLAGLDCLQRMYVLNKDGQRIIDKRSSQRQLSSCQQRCSALMYLNLDLMKQQRRPELVQMDYEKTKELIIEKFEQLEDVMALDAWQLNEIMNQENGVLQSIQESHPLLDILAIQTIDVKLSAYERLRAETIALETITSVLTFREDKDRLPVNLSELQEAGLLEKLPIDPFSGQPLEYKKIDDDFTIYSYGSDFDDDGGVRIVDYDMRNGDIVSWPVKKHKEINTQTP